MTDKKLFACDDCAISKALSCLIEDQRLSEWTTVRFKIQLIYNCDNHGEMYGWFKCVKQSIAEASDKKENGTALKRIRTFTPRDAES